LKTNPTSQSKLLGFFYLIKNFLVKITLITLIVKIFKRFALIRRLWLILNTIVISIFGLSILDLYGFTFISALWTEIISITGNFINYLTNTKFYHTLIGLFGYKIESSTKMESMNRTDQSSTRISTAIKENSEVSDWFNPVDKQEEIIEDTPFYKNKYLIWGTFLLISGVTYYYCGDEIKVYSISLWNLLKGRRPGEDPGHNPPNNPTNRFNSISDFLGLNQNNYNNGNILAQMVDADGSEAIEILDETKVRKLEKAVSFVDKSKSSILTSPSLENLNSTVEEGWSDSRPTSPESIASTSTIRQRIIPKIKVDTGFSNSSAPPSDPVATLPVTPEGYKDEALTPNDLHFKPFVTVEDLNGNTQYVYNEANWKSFANKGVQDRMEFVENALANGNIKDLNKEQLYKLHDKATDITEAYNQYALAYISKREDFEDDTIQPLKYFGYLMRGWLQKHLPMIWPDEDINIPLGDKTDSPIKISNDIFDISSHAPTEDDSSNGSDSE
jgi:hypothetical protein